MGVSPDTATGAKDFSVSMKFSFSLLHKLSKSLSKNTIKMGKWGFPLLKPTNFVFTKAEAFILTIFFLGEFSEINSISMNTNFRLRPPLQGSISFLSLAPRALP